MYRKKRNIKKVNNFRVLLQSSGSITFKVLLAVIIIGSILFVSGIFPSTQITPIDYSGPKYRPNLNDETINKDSLQLKTIGFEQCSQKAAVSLVVDYSGSMAPDFGPRKLPAMHDALKAFGDQLTDNSLIGLHAFNTRNIEVIPFSLFNDQRATYNTKVDSLNRPDGATYTRSALMYVREKIAAAQSQWPDYQYTLILLSDGIPERPGTPTVKSCPHPQGGFRNFSATEDPRQEPNIATLIKNMGVRIFAIAILDQNDQCFSESLQELMQDVSSPDSYYATYNPDDLKDIYGNIVFEVCESIE